MTEDSHRWWDVVTKVAGVLVTLVGAAVAIGTYAAQQQLTRAQNDKDAAAARAQAEKDKLERDEQYKRRIWERRLEIYLQACQSATALATLAKPDDDQYVKSRLRFEQLYHGEMCVVESTEVAARMINFRTKLLAAEQRNKEPKGDAQALAKAWDDLRRASLDLARECRVSIEQDLQINFGKIEAKP